VSHKVVKKSLLFGINAGEYLMRSLLIIFLLSCTVGTTVCMENAIAKKKKGSIYRIKGWGRGWKNRPVWSSADDKRTGRYSMFVVIARFLNLKHHEHGPPYKIELKEKKKND